jgi:hypothetical protein
VTPSWRQSRLPEAVHESWTYVAALGEQQHRLVVSPAGILFVFNARVKTKKTERMFCYTRAPDYINQRPKRANWAITFWRSTSCKGPRRSIPMAAGRLDHHFLPQPGGGRPRTADDRRVHRRRVCLGGAIVSRNRAKPRKRTCKGHYPVASSDARTFVRPCVYIRVFGGHHLSARRRERRLCGVLTTNVYINTSWEPLKRCRRGASLLSRGPGQDEKKGDTKSAAYGTGSDDADQKVAQRIRDAKVSDFKQLDCRQLDDGGILTRPCGSR